MALPGIDDASVQKKVAELERLLSVITAREERQSEDGHYVDEQVYGDQPATRTWVPNERWMEHVHTSEERIEAKQAVLELYDSSEGVEKQIALGYMIQNCPPQGFHEPAHFSLKEIFYGQISFDVWAQLSKLVSPEGVCNGNAGERYGRQWSGYLVMRNAQGHLKNLRAKADQRA